MHSYPPHGSSLWRSQSPESKLSFTTNSSPKCKAILPHNFTNPSHSICREGFVPIMQNLYKSFPTNESLLFLFFFFIFHFMFISFYSFYFFFLIFFFFFYFFWGFFFFFSKLEILPQRRKFIPQHLGGIIEE